MTRPRFSLRWLLVFVLLVATYFGGFLHGRRWQRQHDSMLFHKTVSLTDQLHTARYEARRLKDHLASRESSP